MSEARDGKSNLIGREFNERRPLLVTFEGKQNETLLGKDHILLGTVEIFHDLASITWEPPGTSLSPKHRNQYSYLIEILPGKHPCH